MAALHQWSHTEPQPLDAKCISTAEEWINDVIHPHSAGGPLPCVSTLSLSSRTNQELTMQFIQTPEEVPGTYGENFPRLQQIKNIFDPTHFIQHAMWPTPAEKAEKERAVKGKQRENKAVSSNDEQTASASASIPAPAQVISQLQSQAQAQSQGDNRRTRLPSETLFISENIVHPDGSSDADPDAQDTQAKASVEVDEGLSKTRLEAIRGTPLSGVQEHKDNVPSENMNLEETVKAAASSA